MTLDAAARKKQSFVGSVRLITVAAISFFLYGCLTLRQPTEMKFTRAVSIDSLSSNASLAFKGSHRSFTGSGYILFKKPDQIRMVILSPFGSVLQEVFVSGELVTIVDAGNGVAFIGTRRDLPDVGDFSSWRYIHWIIDIDPPGPAWRTAIIDRVNVFGQQEKATFENGILISKSTAEGGLVKYGNYKPVQGVAVPFEITYEAAASELFTIQLEEPEVNIPIAEDAFTPDLGKYRRYPLSSLK